MASHGQSEACCSVPPVISEGYKQKGTYIDLPSGLKCYATGPSDATTAILIVYDIFGFSPQALQGADILAHADSSHQYRVYIPDLFDGKPLDMSVYPPDTDEKKKILGDFFGGRGAPAKNAEAIIKSIKEIQGEADGIQKWGGVGMCWGGKVIILASSGPSNPFTAAAQVHPAMVSAADAETIKIPFCLLASRDEPADEVAKFKDTLTVPHHVETFSDQTHGWMAARGDLKDERVKSEYERGYKTLLSFFHEYL